CGSTMLWAARSGCGAVRRCTSCSMRPSTSAGGTWWPAQTGTPSRCGSAWTGCRPGWTARWGLCSADNRSVLLVSGLQCIDDDRNTVSIATQTLVGAPLVGALLVPTPPIDVEIAQSGP